MLNGLADVIYGVDGRYGNVKLFRSDKIGGLRDDCWDSGLVFGFVQVKAAIGEILKDDVENADARCQIAAQNGCGAEVTATADRRAALAEADYVINEVQVGGYAATRADFDIPARYGVRQTIGDTLGIGGIFRGLRTIPVTVALARDMAEVCPDAYLLSYSNPMAMLPWAVYEGSAFTRVFGLCHSVRDTQAFLTQLTGADPERVRFLTAGFNHQAFVLRFEQDGESLYPRLAQVIEASPDLQRRVRVEIYRRFGYFPTESSEHSAEYVPWFMRHDDQIEEFRIFVGDYLERSEENLRELE